MLAPRQIAEPGYRPVTKLSGFREIRKKWRRPALQPITVKTKPALTSADCHITSEHRIRYLIPCGDQSVRIAFPKAKSGKDDALRTREGDQLAQHQRGERHHVKTPARDRGYSLKR